MAAGAEWVCVADTIMRLTAIPQRRLAMTLASSIKACGIMQVSTTTSAICVVPSSSTTLRTKSGSCTTVAVFSRKLPAMIDGGFGGALFGEISIAAAPARKGFGTGSPQAIPAHAMTTEIAAVKRFIRGAPRVEQAVDKLLWTGRCGPVRAAPSKNRRVSSGAVFISGQDTADFSEGIQGCR